MKANGFFCTLPLDTPLVIKRFEDERFGYEVIVEKVNKPFKVNDDYKKGIVQPSNEKEKKLIPKEEIKRRIDSIHGRDKPELVEELNLKMTGDAYGVNRTINEIIKLGNWLLENK